MDQIQNFNFTEIQLFILQNHYNSCPMHPENQIISLSNSTDHSQQLQCPECISESPNQNTITLSSILKSEQQTIFKNWPIYGDKQLYDKVYEISTRKPFVEDLQQRIQTYFKQLKEQIANQISQKEIQMMSSAKSLWNLNEQVIISYNHYTGKDEIKNIIKNKKDDFEEQNKLLKLEVSRILQNQSRNKQSLLDTITLLKSQEDMINFETPNQLRENIVKQIENIDMFTIKNFHDIKINSFEADFESYKNKIMEMKVSEMTTSELMVKLMSNKLNNCSKELLDNLFQIILRISSFLDKQNFKSNIQEDLLFNNFEEFNQKQVDNGISNKLSNHTTSIVGERLSNSQLNEITKLIQDLEYSNIYLKGTILNEQRKEIDNNCDLLVSDFDNKSNLCSEELIDNQKIMTQKYPEITQNLFLKQSIFDQNQNHPIKFVSLDDKQIKNVEKLIVKICELNDKFGDDYKKGNIQFLKEQTSINQICNTLKRTLNKKILQQLLIDYPILQIQDLSFGEKIKIDFIKTTQGDSQSLILEVNQQGNPIVKQEKSLYGQIVTKDCLDSNLNYIFRCKLNKNLKCNFISFGIMLTQDVNQKELYNDKCCFMSSSKEYGLDKIIKGKNLLEVRDEINELEIRVNIRNKVLMYSDYPNYNHINSTHLQKIDNQKEYSFGFRFGRPGDDYIIEVTDILITDDYNIDKFNQN